MKLLKFNEFVNEALVNNLSNYQFYEEVLPYIKDLGNNPIICRAMRVPNGKNFEVDSEGWKKGTVGIDASVNKDQMSFFEKFTNHFKLKNMVFTVLPSSIKDYFKTRSLFGTPFIFIPKDKYKLIWSPDVQDIGSTLRLLKNDGKSYDEVDFNKYETKWPQSTRNEIIFDCDSYYLLDLNQLSFCYGAIWSMLINKDIKPIGKSPGKKVELQDPKTYSDIVKFIEWTVINNKNLNENDPKRQK